MKIAVISTQFLETYVKNIYQSMPFDCAMDFYIYRDFMHAGDLYLELMDEYDGFLVSGPVPRAAICRRVQTLTKPIVSFGSNALCYYETFFKVQYEQDDFYFEHGYFDLLEWKDHARPLHVYLEEGKFDELIHEIYRNTSTYSLEQLRKLEETIKEKHIRLWRQGAINYSVTRFSNIMPDLLNAGVKAYFVYPHRDILQESLTNLLQDIHLKTMLQNQMAIAELGSNYSSSFSTITQPPASGSGTTARAEIDIEEFSGKSGLSVLSSQRLLAALTTMDCSHVTSQMLAAALNITTRSANRILSRLLECGIAQVTYEQQISMRGRPEKVYQIFPER